MPAIMISDQAIKELYRAISPFIAEYLEPKHPQAAGEDGAVTQVSGTSSATVRQFHTTNPPNLLHATLREAEFGGVGLDNPNWQKLMHLVVKEAKSKAETGAEFTELTKVVNLRQGNDNRGAGWTYLPEADVTVQAVDANRAWKAAVRVAQALELPLKVTFAWPHGNSKAAYPGVTGMMSTN